jgi:hypothetical protein
MTVELLRPVPVAPLKVDATLSRPGRKVRLVVVHLIHDGADVASGTVLGIRRADVDVPDQPKASPLPGPATVAAATPRRDWPAFHNAGVEHRFVEGGFEIPGPATDWIRLHVPVVPGEEPTGLQRVAAAADFGNGVSRVTDFDELLFINPDLTIYLHRQPVGEWIGLEAASVLEPSGNGYAESALWDEGGRIGRACQALLVEKRA